LQSESRAAMYSILVLGRIQPNMSEVGSF
jgi:hypothetical protein